jgi:NADPH:quinone reductase-like Zn-dependent oxidoreductase
VNAAQIQAGETILIVCAAGTVGQAATQIANSRVIGADITSDPIPRYRGVTHEAPRAAVEMRTPISRMSQAQDTQPVISLSGSGPALVFQHFPMPFLKI